MTKHSGTQLFFWIKVVRQISGHHSKILDGDIHRFVSYKKISQPAGGREGCPQRPGTFDTEGKNKLDLLG